MTGEPATGSVKEITVRWRKSFNRPEMVSDDILSFGVGGSQRTAGLIDLTGLHLSITGY